MKALSIHQPWAWAILHAGKAVENRSWLTNYRGPLLIHASKSEVSYLRQSKREWNRRYKTSLPEWDSLAKGAIVGIVDLVDCVYLNTWTNLSNQQRGATDPHIACAMSSSWVEGSWCWILANPRAFQAPVAYKGAQQVFEISDTFLKQSQIAEHLPLSQNRHIQTTL